MDLISGLLLLLSTLLSTARNIFSKGISVFEFGTKKFYLSQAVIFFGGGISAVLFDKVNFSEMAFITLVYSVIYAALLVSAQWFYTTAMATGNVSVCATVYSLGFILPTLSGSIFWSEKLDIFDVIGIICVAIAILLSALKTKSPDSESKTNKYIVPLIIAFFASGGLGIMQKVQQKSPFPEQKGIFIFISFMLAAVISFLFFLFAKKSEEKLKDKKLFMAAAIGICIGCVSLLNTTLIGRLKSSIFFPTFDIIVIFMSILSGIIIFKEKLTKRNTVVFALGILSIILLNL